MQAILGAFDGEFPSVPRGNDSSQNTAAAGRSA